MSGVFTSDIPEAVVDYVAEAIIMGDFQRDALDLAERRLGIDRQRMDRGIVRARWLSRWSRSERSKTLAVVEAAVNDVLRNDHLGRLAVDRRIEELPEALRHPEVQGGVLTVKDAKRTVGSVYLRSFLEVSPPEIVVRTVHVAAAHRSTLGLKATYPFPLAWDVTSGSGTVRRVLGALRGSVVSSDLTPQFNDLKLDARHMGEARHHREPFVRRAPDQVLPDLDADTLSINKPHILFLDPPSRGTPTHQELYGGGPPAAQDDGLDLAELDRTTWASVVGGMVVLALHHVARAGVVSLLVREGRREREQVYAEEGLAEEVIGFVRECVPDLVVLDDVRVVYDPVRVCQQTSLGASRLPMRHLVLARKGTAS
jgi:hypothetical protein